VSDPVIEVLPVDGPGTPPPGPEAPWGFKSDGTPYQRDPSRYKKRGGRSKAPTTKRATAPTATARPKPTGKRKAYKEDAAGLLQIAQIPLAVLARVTKNPTFTVDLIAIEKHSDGLTTAIAELAEKNDKVAEALNKLAVAGPYGALVAAITPLVMQLATNHGIPMPGTEDPQAMFDAFVADVEASMPPPPAPYDGGSWPSPDSPPPAPATYPA
jgi:hypothetical protein